MLDDPSHGAVRDDLAGRERRDQQDDRRDHKKDAAEILRHGMVIGPITVMVEGAEPATKNEQREQRGPCEPCPSLPPVTVPHAAHDRVEEASEVPGGRASDPALQHAEPTR